MKELRCQKSIEEFFKYKYDKHTYKWSILKSKWIEISQQVETNKSGINFT